MTNESKIPSEKLPSGESWNLVWDDKRNQPYLLLEEYFRVYITAKEAMEIYFKFQDDEEE